MDDIDNFFGEEACDAFVSGIKIEPGQEDREEVAKQLIENEEMLTYSLLGPNAEEDSKKGKYSGLS
jgi:hypothetical protein